MGCCSARPGQRGTGPAPPAAPAPGSWTGSGQECQEFGAAVSFPLLFLPPLREQDIPCPGKPAAIPFMGKPQGMWWAPLLPWGGHSVQESLGGWHHGGAHSGSGQDRDLLRTYYVPRASFTGINSITPTLRGSFPGEETDSEEPGNMPEGTSWQVAKADLVQASLIVEPTCS